MSELHDSYSSKSKQTTRVKVKRKTVGITVPTNLIEKARKHKLNISRVTTEALTSIIAYLEQPEIDFLQGRVSANVFMRNYFNPTWITDLKTRTFKCIKEIEESLS